MFPFDLLSPVINKVLDYIPDPKMKAEAQLAAQKALLDHEDKIMASLTASDTAQAAVNLEEAKADNWFKSCWRPAFGWVGVLGFAWSVLIQPMAAVVYSAHTGHPLDLPVLNTSLLETLCFGLLGLGAYRSYEKKNGVN